MCKFTCSELETVYSSHILNSMCSLIYTEYIKIVDVTCTTSDLSMNSKCYRKFDRQQSWYDASNDCLSHGESLAVFTDIRRPSDNNDLTAWLNASGTDKSYWIGLIRSWWKTTDEGNVLLSCSYNSKMLF